MKLFDPVTLFLCREFEVTDGVIHGCPGLEPFAEMRNTSIIKTVMDSAVS